MENFDVSHEIITKLRICGHFLYYKMGDKAGRKRIMNLLLRGGSLKQKDLQDELGIQSGSLSEVIGKLEAEGFVKKVRSDEDGRNYVLSLTDKGESKAKLNHERYDARVKLMTDCLTEEEKTELIKLLKKLEKHWFQIDEDGMPWQCD